MLPESHLSDDRRCRYFADGRRSSSPGGRGGLRAALRVCVNRAFNSGRCCCSSFVRLRRRLSGGSGGGGGETTLAKSPSLLLSLACFLFVLLMLTAPPVLELQQSAGFVGVLRESATTGPHGDQRQLQPQSTTEVVATSFPVTDDADRVIEQEQRRRQRRLIEVCNQRPDVRRQLTKWRYKVDIRHGLIYCPIPKAGWSSWKRWFFAINGAINSSGVDVGITPDNVAGLIDMRFDKINQALIAGQFNRTMFSFVFVRNPWERLVSAYINKAIDWNYSRILHSPCSWESMYPYMAPISFTQFLRCVLDQAYPTSGRRQLDMHWTPMSLLCDFCHFNYDHIGHLETIEADAAYILKKSGISFALPHVFSSRAYRASDVIKPWYTAVPPDIVHGLSRLFHADFLLHGYSDKPPGWEEGAP